MEADEKRRKLLRELEVGRKNWRTWCYREKKGVRKSHTGLKRKVVTFCLSSQRLSWVRVSDNARNLEPNAGKTLFDITSNFITLIPKGCTSFQPFSL